MNGSHLALMLACLTGLACHPGRSPTEAGGPGPGDQAKQPDAAPRGPRLQGVVWGPNRTFPVAGALVAALRSAPPPIPEGTYCQRCVDLPATPYAITAADGTFSLDLPPGESFSLVVQKGEFRRVRAMRTPEAPGPFTLEESFTTLPSRRDDALGDTIPHIALVYGDYDSVGDLLAKAGLGRLSASNSLVWGSEQGIFDVYDNAGPGEEHHGAPLRELLLDPARLARYHIILFACSYNANFSFMKDPRIQTNLREFVRRGGKLYVSDYAYAVAELPWPRFVQFTNPLRPEGCQEDRFPDGCNHGPPFDAPSRSPDQGLSAWLLAVDRGATPSRTLRDRADFVTKENWDTIGGLGEDFIGDNVDTGRPESQLPRVWVEGQWSYGPADAAPEFDRESYHPFTVSWPYGCGRVLFTTYHTVGGTGSASHHQGLLTQERILWYLLMELQACQDLRIQ